MAWVGAPGRSRISDKVLSKHYGSLFIWGQLNGWWKQTVYDPTASLSADRRGTLSLPDVECAYSDKAGKGYSVKVSRAQCMGSHIL
jgi:hypothetical protein